MHGLPIDFPNDAPKRLNGDAPRCGNDHDTSPLKC